MSTLNLTHFWHELQSVKIKKMQWIEFFWFLVAFMVVYGILFLISWFGIQERNINHYLAVSYFTLTFAIISVFWDSDILRGMVWVVIPGFLIFLINWHAFALEMYFTQGFLDDHTNEIVINHIPLDLLVGFYLFQINRSHKTNWRIIPYAGIIWMIYLTIVKFAIPGYYHGWFPYRYGIMITLMIFGMIIMTLVFVSMEKRDYKKQISQDQLEKSGNSVNSVNPTTSVQFLSKQKH